MTPRDRRTAAQALIAATIRIASEGLPLMTRVAPQDGAFVVWDHYPPDDAVDPASGARWFYHAHPPGEREEGEHGHFHLFFDRALLGGQPIAGPIGGVSSGADVVHVAAIAIGMDGLPFRLFTVNRWVTDEWLYPAEAIAPLLPRFRFDRAGGDALVNAWLSAAVAFFRPVILDVLRERDRVIAGWAADGPEFEDRAREVLSGAAIDINQAAAFG